MNDPLTSALALLPHGMEFRFIDRLLSLEPGKTGVGEYRVKGTEPFLRGHFPREADLPGVLLLEATAQLAAVVAQSDPQVTPLAGLKLAGFRNAKITGTARPEEIIRLQATVTGRLAGLVQATTAAWVEDQLILRGELTLSAEPARADCK